MKTLVAASVLFAGLALADLPAAEQKPEVVPEAAAPKHPQGIENAGAGVISGGWEYVYAAYTLGTLGVLGFATSLFFRRPKAQPERTS
ncbi:MAG: hypothetical protein Q8S33_24260 [Myxococcales bacterium]|nr:hypothetical protein [Myxococcales bacterium]MDP3503470.1 hypothetical protein [Myxococcales bacterium]